MIAFGLCNEGKLRIVRRPRTRGRNEGDRVEVRIARRSRELLDHATGLRVGDEQLDLEQPASRKKRHEFAVGAHLRRQIHLAALAIALQNGIARLIRTRAPLEHGEIRAPRRRNPILRQRVRGNAEHAPNAVFKADAQRRAIHVHDGAIAPASAHIRPERLAVPIRKEARIGIQLLDRRQPVAFRGVAQPHGRERIVASEREVLRHALDQPERKGVQSLQSAGSGLGDAVLEHVYQLVAEHVIVVRVDAGERHYYARTQPLGHTARALGQLLADDIRLLEVRLIGVKYDGLAIERVTETVRVARVPSFSQSARVVNHERFRRIEIEIKMRRPRDAEVEMLVLDLVAAEILCSPAAGESHEKRTQKRQQRYRTGSETGHQSVPRSNRS